MAITKETLHNDLGVVFGEISYVKTALGESALQVNGIHNRLNKLDDKMGSLTEASSNNIDDVNSIKETLAQHSLGMGELHKSVAELTAMLQDISNSVVVLAGLKIAETPVVAPIVKAPAKEFDWQDYPLTPSEKNLIKGGSVIAAIKAYRARLYSIFGACSLQQAKDAMDYYRAQEKAKTEATDPKTSLAASQVQKSKPDFNKFPAVSTQEVNLLNSGYSHEAINSYMTRHSKFSGEDVAAYMDKFCASYPNLQPHLDYMHEFGFAGLNLTDYLQEDEMN